MACGGCGKKRAPSAPSVKVTEGDMVRVPNGIQAGQMFRIKGKPGLYLATRDGAKPITVMI
jgi:hypothetical protein